MTNMFGKGAVLAAMWVAVAGTAGANPSPYGNWKLSDGRLTVKVMPCNGSQVCAKIIGLDNPNHADGTPKLDLKNKNPSLRSRHLIGMPVIKGMAPSGPNSWKGEIYSSDDGNIYRAYATVEGDHLSVKGCWLVICKDLNFHREK